MYKISRYNLEEDKYYTLYGRLGIPRLYTTRDEACGFLESINISRDMYDEFGLSVRTANTSTLRPPPIEISEYASVGGSDWFTLEPTESIHMIVDETIPI